MALGVIFIPMILNTDTEFTISETNIPAKPPQLEQLAEMKTPEPVPLPPAPVLDIQPVDEKTPAQPAQEPVSQTSATTEQTRSDTAPDTGAPEPAAATSADRQDDTKARAWVVQVASFSEQDKAMKLRDRLRKAKYPSFVESVTTKNSKLYRVRVGPVVRRDHADEWQKKIAKEFKVPDALVMAHPG